MHINPGPNDHIRDNKYEKDGYIEKYIFMKMIETKNIHLASTQADGGNFQIVPTKEKISNITKFNTNITSR